MAGRTILLVDDDAFIRAYLRDALAGAGCRLLEARNGAEALGHIATSHPDLVLLDLVMPVMGGLELLESLRALTARPRVVVLSSLAEASLVDDALASGAWGFLPKPCLRQVVQNTVAHALAS